MEKKQDMNEATQRYNEQMDALCGGDHYKRKLLELKMELRQFIDRGRNALPITKKIAGSDAAEAQEAVFGALAEILDR